MTRYRLSAPGRAARTVLALALAVGLAVTGGLSSSAAPAPVPVRVAFTPLQAWGPLFIADAEGYFAREGIKVEWVTFAGGADTIAVLVQGQLDVGAGSASAGFFNALAQGAQVRIVADKGHVEPGVPRRRGGGAQDPPAGPPPHRGRPEGPKGRRQHAGRDRPLRAGPLASARRSDPTRRRGVTHALPLHGGGAAAGGDRRGHPLGTLRPAGPGSGRRDDAGGRRRRRARRAGGVHLLRVEPAGAVAGDRKALHGRLPARASAVRAGAARPQRADCGGIYEDLPRPDSQGGLVPHVPGRAREHQRHPPLPGLALRSGVHRRAHAGERAGGPGGSGLRCGGTHLAVSPEGGTAMRTLRGTSWVLLVCALLVSVSLPAAA